MSKGSFIQIGWSNLTVCGLNAKYSLNISFINYGMVSCRLICERKVNDKGGYY